MNAKATMYTLATCLVVVSAAAMTSSRSWFEAYTSGARTVALRGKASYGTVGENGSGAFVVTLGANAPEGAVLFTRADGRALTPGIYPLAEDSARGVQALEVAWNEGAQQLVPEFVHKFEVSFPVGYSEWPPIMTYMGFSVFDRPVTPLVVVIDRKGVIRAQTPAEGDSNLQNEAKLRVLIDGLLAKTQ